MAEIVVIGAGQAGFSLVAKLRSGGFEGGITLVGDEPVPPYQRPPLSKAYLLGEMEESRLYFRPESFYEDNNITLLTGSAVTSIDALQRNITVADRILPYDQLALTTGSSPVPLPASIGGSLGNVFTVRSLRDVDAIAAATEPGARALIIGGGYIGLEAAAVASKLGLQVTLVELADRILQRVASPQTSDYFRTLHRQHGVDIREGAGVKRLVGHDTVTTAELTDGTMLETDIVIVGIGIRPNTSLAQEAGLVLDNGIAVDEFGQTSDPAIYAAGDCASFPYRGGRLRLESVQNAIDQAEAVASNMMGDSLSYVPQPWFWSDQFDVKLQIAGLNTGHDSVVTRAGEKAEAQSHWYYAGDTLLAVDAMNDPRAYMIGKRLIEGGSSPDKTIIEDASYDLKALLKRA